MLFPFRARTARVIVLTALAAAVTFAPVSFAARPGGLQSVPLTDDYGGGASPGNAPAAPAPGTPMQTAPVSPAPAAQPQGVPSGAPAGTPTVRANTGGGNDAAVLAYLIELARKQGKPCPSGSTPPVPPSLTFSEPLCRAAESLSQGTDAPSAFAAQDVHVAKWRTFSAPDYPAQSVAAALRQSHCEALLEPFTHIGVSRNAKGWNVILVELAEKPSGDAAPVAPADSAASAPAAAARPSAQFSAQAAPQNAAPAAAAAPLASSAAPSAVSAASEPVVLPGQPVSLPGEAEAPSRLAVPAPNEPDKAAGFTGQEARTLFVLLNEKRAKGGVCYGKVMPPAPPLAYQADLQSAAEAGAAESRAKSGSALAPLSLPLYSGTNVTKLHAVTEARPAAVLDVWMMNPANCEAVYSPVFSDAGVGFADGHWVVLIGGTGRGVDSPEPPGAAAKEGLEPPASPDTPPGR